MRKVAKNQSIKTLADIISDFTRINVHWMLFIHIQTLCMDMNLGEAHIPLEQNSSMLFDSIVVLWV